MISTQEAAVSGLQPYSGTWTNMEAGHLLRRTTFGPSYAQIKRVSEQGLQATLDELLADLPLPAPPQATDAEKDAPVGETWVNRPYSRDAQRARVLSLSGWQSGLLLEEGLHLREQMTLFWHNHFPVSNVNDPRASYLYLHTLRQHALGNFRELTRAVTIDPAMLRYLNGNQNRAVAPNENYARELLELFTVGKGPQVGPGDYTNYTEDDVREIARALTGWVIRGYRDNDSGSIQGVFVPARHDPGTKQLSARFGNATIENHGGLEYQDVIDIILEQEATSLYIVRKLYRWFVYYEITDEIETQVIEPLAALFRSENYDVKPVLRALLGSEHFFDVRSQGPMIKNPVTFCFSLFRQLEVPIADAENARNEEEMRFRLLRQTGILGMGYLDAPTVAGWKAYYQEPLYYRNWIDSNTLLDRTRLTDQLTTTGFVAGRGVRINVELLPLIQQFSAPADLPLMIRELTQLLLPRPLTPGQLDYLRNLVIPGLPDTQWAVEYANYLSNPNDESIVAALETKLRRTLNAILTMPEYHLS